MLCPACLRLPGTPLLPRFVLPFALLLALGLAAPPVAAQGAQGSDGTPGALAPPESLRLRQMVQLSPHLLLLDSKTKSATLEFRNPSDSVKQATVQVQFAYLDGPHGLPADTTIIDPTGKVVEPYDTVIAQPGPTDHFAGRWLSGVPTTVTLAPHATKRVTIRIAPPPTLPAGEYWARIQTVVPTAPRRGGTRDVRQRYAVPTKLRVPLLRDTCLVLYRQGLLHMGIAIGPGAIARIDSANIGGVDHESFSHALWVRLPLHLTGNVPFRGMMHSEYRNLTTGEVVNPNRLPFLLMKDGVEHTVIETDVLSPGSWEYTLTFDSDDPDLPPGLRLPMPPVRQVFRFEVLPAWEY